MNVQLLDRLFKYISIGLMVVGIIFYVGFYVMLFKMLAVFIHVPAWIILIAAIITIFAYYE